MFDPECTICCIAGSAKCAIHSENTQQARIKELEQQLSVATACVHAMDRQTMKYALKNLEQASSLLEGACHELIRNIDSSNLTKAQRSEVMRKVSTACLDVKQCAVVIRSRS